MKKKPKTQESKSLPRTDLQGFPRTRKKRKRRDVGYKRPPKEDQFQPGQSGNPKGCPAKPKRPKRQPRQEYKVGYCRPPKEHQFKPGQSGNPNGRPPAGIYALLHQLSAKNGGRRRRAGYVKPAKQHTSRESEPGSGAVKSKRSRRGTVKRIAAELE
jgi:hypothetical protein